MNAFKQAEQAELVGVREVRARKLNIFIESEMSQELNLKKKINQNIY